MSQNKNMWITQFWHKCQLEPYNTKVTKYNNDCLKVLDLSSEGTAWHFWLIFYMYEQAAQSR